MSFKVFGRKKKLDWKWYNPFVADTLVRSFEYWELRESEQPYEHTERHLVLWEKQNVNIKNRKYFELKELIDKYRDMWYSVVFNSTPDRSVLHIEHCHLIKFENYDKVICFYNDKW